MMPRASRLLPTLAQIAEPSPLGTARLCLISPVRVPTTRAEFFGHGDACKSGGQTCPLEPRRRVGNQLLAELHHASRLPSIRDAMRAIDAKASVGSRTLVPHGKSGKRSWELHGGGRRLGPAAHR